MSKLLKHPVVIFILLLSCAISLLVAVGLAENEADTGSAPSPHLSAQSTTPP